MNNSKIGNMYLKFHRATPSQNLEIFESTVFHLVIDSLMLLIETICLFQKGTSYSLILRRIHSSFLPLYPALMKSYETDSYRTWRFENAG